MGFGGSLEGGLDDDGGDFMAAAELDVVLAAKILIGMSRSGAPGPSPPEPPRHLLEVVQDLELRWELKGWRSRTITMAGILAAEKEEAATRASPTTPLSWSRGGCGTSGSECGSSPPHQRWKRPSGNEHGLPETTAGIKRIRALPAESSKPEPCKNAEAAPAALGSSNSSASDKVIAVAAAPVEEPASSTPVAHLERPSLRSTVGGTAPVVVGRPGKKKKTLGELQAMRESLLQEQEGLRKDLERQKVMHNALFEENRRLKELESSLSSHTESRPTSTHVLSEEAKLEQLQHVEPIPELQAVKVPCTASVAAEEEEEETPGEPQCAAPGRMFLFDLNSLPDDDF